MHVAASNSAARVSGCFGLLSGQAIDCLEKALRQDLILHVSTRTLLQAGKASQGWGRADTMDAQAAILKARDHACTGCVKQGHCSRLGGRPKDGEGQTPWMHRLQS